MCKHIFLANNSYIFSMHDYSRDIMLSKTQEQIELKVSMLLEWVMERIIIIIGGKLFIFYNL